MIGWGSIIKVALLFAIIAVFSLTSYRLGSLQNENGNLKALNTYVEQTKRRDDEIRNNAPIKRNAIIDRLYYNAR